MKFMHYRIDGNPGEMIRIKLDGAAFVRLLDPLNFSAYQVGRKFTGMGGWYEIPVVEFTLPYKGTFHLVIDLNGQEGVVKAIVDKIKK